MKAHLMYRDRDFGQELESLVMRPWVTEVRSELLLNEKALTQDLELNTLFGAMAGGDECLFAVARQAILSALQDDLETILYRQAVLKDCLRNESVVRSLYDIAVEATVGERRRWLGIASRFPRGILWDSLRLLQVLMGELAKLKHVADQQAGNFESEGFTVFFRMLKTELADDYFAAVKAQLQKLEFKDGVLMGAELGEGNQGVNYVLRKSLRPKPNWIQRFFSWNSSDYTFHLDPRDEGGFQALSELEERGINQVANATAQSADHVSSFFARLRTELAFYVGCLNLHRQLGRKGVPVCFPVPASPGARKLSCVGLCDASLVLSMESSVVGNDLNADGKNLVIITGANQGGKSTFLRGIGLAQLMMQCGMFVAAKSFSADICRSIFTHYKREEDASMKSGKFDEELDRMNSTVDALTPNSLLLFNESFAATNEREGSEIATQIIRALLETRVKIFFVTHLYEFAHGLWENKMNNATFLRAERQANGQRTYKLLTGEPLETSFGADLYGEIFENGDKVLAS